MVDRALTLHKPLKRGAAAPATEEGPRPRARRFLPTRGPVWARPTATLEKTRLLAAYLRTLSDDDLRRAAIFMTGRPFGPSRRSTLGLGWSTLSKVVGTISRHAEDDLQGIFRKHSDLGDWAGDALEGRTQNEDAPPEHVATTLVAIATARRASNPAPPH